VADHKGLGALMLEIPATFILDIDLSGRPEGGKA
jgi:hypothetical protein